MKYRIHVIPNKQLGIDFGDTGDTFELRPVAETNIFVLRIRTGSTVDVTTPSCTCDSNPEPDSRQCNCDCLCYTPITFNVCKNTYTISLSDSSLPCSARLLDTSSISVVENLDGIQSCYDPKCYAKNKSDCYSESQCSWCEFTDIGDILSPPCCRLKGNCSFGKASSSHICDGPVIYKSSPSGANIGAIVGGTLGGIVFAVILVLGVIYIIKQQQKRQKIHI